MSKIDISKWEELITKGIRYKERFCNSKRWSTYRNYGRGIFSGYKGDSSGILPYNLVYAMKRALVPNVYYRNPYINVTPSNKPGADFQARIVEAIDNQLLITCGIKGVYKTMVQDAYYSNRGIAKIGYDGLWSEINKMKDTDAQLAEDLGIPVSHMSVNNKERVAYNTNVKPGMPWAARIMSEFLIVPFGTRTLTDCPWVDHVIIKSLEDVKNSKIYKNTKDLSGTHLEMLNKTGMDSEFYRGLGEGADLVEIHEIHNFKTKEICAFVPGYDKYIREPSEDVLQIGGLPFVDFTFNEDPEYYWGPSDVQIIEPQQLEVNEARTQAMQHRRVSLIKFLIEENGMDPVEVEKMLSSQVGPAAFTKGDPRQTVTTLQPHIPPDLIQWTEIIRGDVRELLGQGSQQLGEAPPGRRSATEMSNVQISSDLRMDERRDIVADSLSEMVRKFNQIIFDRWSTEKVAQVVGVDGARYWVAYKGNENRAEYTLKVDVESMSPKTKATKKRDILEVIQAVSNNPRANVDYLLRMLLREYDWIDAMKVLPEAPETMQQPMSQADFMHTQQKLMQNPQQMQTRASANAKVIGRGLGV